MDSYRLRMNRQIKNDLAQSLYSSMQGHVIYILEAKSLCPFGDKWLCPMTWYPQPCLLIIAASPVNYKRGGQFIFQEDCFWGFSQKYVQTVQDVQRI